MKFVVRVRYVQPDGIGYLTADGWVTCERRYAKEYNSEAFAWNHGLARSDYIGPANIDWWVEPALPPAHAGPA